MQGRKKLKIIGLGFMILGVCLLACGGWVDHQADVREESVRVHTQEVQQILKQDVIPEEPVKTPTVVALQSVEIQGRSYIGLLDIPALALSLPVEKDFSYPALNSNVCRYVGSCSQQNMIIAGHNYACHFGSLKNLQTGDAVIFTDVLGVIHTYHVAQIEILEETAVEELPWDQPGLTMFTCTPGGLQRVVVRCSPDE